MALLFSYSPEDRTNPIGANNLAARAKFYQRALYKQVIYPAGFPRPIDTWYDKPLYGKADPVQNAIVLKNNKIVSVMSSPDVQAADFVAAAFEAFSKYMKEAKIRGILNSTTDGILSRIYPASGWVSPFRSYEQYSIKALRDNFVELYGNAKQGHVRDFPTFVVEMNKYIKQVARTMPVTLTSYVLSPMISSRCSGLSISIGGFDTSNDQLKYQKFISNPNFEFYRCSAKKFGLLVNKNMPWVLTADLFTKNIDTLFSYVYNQALGAAEAATRVNKDNFFSEYYFPTCLYDVDMLKTLYVATYARLIELYPFYDIEVPASERCPYKTITENVWRPTHFTLTDLNFLMSLEDWLDLYIELRDTEAGGTKHSLSNIRRRALEVHAMATLTGHANPLVAAFIYVNQVYRRYLYSPDFTVMMAREMTFKP
jgi:hypothetical protein